MTAVPLSTRDLKLVMYFSWLCVRGTNTVILKIMLLCTFEWQTLNVSMETYQHQKAKDGMKGPSDCSSLSIHSCHIGTSFR